MNDLFPRICDKAVSDQAFPVPRSPRANGGVHADGLLQGGLHRAQQAVDGVGLGLAPVCWVEPARGPFGEVVVVEEPEAVKRVEQGGWFSPIRSIRSGLAALGPGQARVQVDTARPGAI